MKRFARFARPDGTAFCAEVEGTSPETDVAYVLDNLPWDGGRRTGEEQAALGLARLCPAVPSKILCVGRNYAAHAKELGHEVPAEPLLFLKPPSALLDPGGTILLPRESERVEHEAELGVLIGRRARNVRREDALHHVFGYTCVGDITARDLQKKDGQWTRAKGFDTFCPVGPQVVSGLDPTRLRVIARVGGQTRQDGLTAHMIFDVATLIAYASRVMTLEPGDLLVTGTPEGVGPLLPGDVLDIEVCSAEEGQPGIGVLSVRVAAPPPP